MMVKSLCITLLRTTFMMLLICNLSLANTRIAVLGDRTGGADQGVFDGIIDEINLLQPDMLINIGDLIEGPQPNEAAIHKQWDIVMNSMSRLKCPVYYVPGNNDIFNEESRRIYTERTGSKPEYSFDFNELHFVVIDNSEMRRWKTMTPERMQWLESDLSGAVDAVLTIVVFHKPFWISNFSKERRDMMHELFVKYGVDWVFSGHHHRYTATTRDDINYVMVGSSGGHIGNNKYRGELYHFGWMTEDSGSSQFAMLDAGHIRPHNWLTLEDRLTQDDLEGCLLTISRPMLVSGTSKCAIQLSFGDDCNVSGGDFAWDLNDTNWVISPSTGVFNVGAGKTVIDCSALIKGSRYPLPKLTIHTEIKGREYEIYNFLTPVIRADLGRETGELIIDGQIIEPGWRGDSVAILDDFGGDYGRIIPTDPIEIRVIQEGDRLCFGISAIVSEPMDEMPETKPDRD
ncbi:metallophosphoesterase, partial [bacterium]|nr:metallophosphoesterase [bacterium]